MYFGNNKISEKLNWHNEIQYRNFNWGGDLEQLLLRTGIGYNLSPNNNNILLGYGFILSKPYQNNEKTSTKEHRIFQQYIHLQSIGRVFIQNRYRLEERFVENDFKMRFRYFMGFNIPLNQRSMLPRTVYLSFYDEIFLNLNAPVFDRNRAYGALGYKIDHNFRIEAGYMFQQYEGSRRGQFQLAVFNSLTFLHKKEE
ncbi:MAG: DUF2490 domain-containing protein [Chitinophagales bacterium]|nr:DUF2490 domain-containing protein [Bacteroidota bacterium]MCB9043917.1 DUF2490 domain-containing protein [Chitinophagales bacterium]